MLLDSGDFPRTDYQGIFVWPRGGNTGDDLIRLGCLKFLETMGINVWVSDGSFEKAALDGNSNYLNEFFSAHKGYIFFPGGGNIGIYGDNERIREAIIGAATAAKGILIFSQSCFRIEKCLQNDKVTVWARDSISRQHLESSGVRSELVPDMALFLDDEFPKIPHGRGEFFIQRKTGRCSERVDHGLTISARREDLTYDHPIGRITKKLSPYRTVISDRLHGGLIAIMMRKRTGLLPVSYHKTKSFYDTWLSSIPGTAYIQTQDDLDSFLKGDTTPDVDLKGLHVNVASQAMLDFIKATGGETTQSFPANVKPVLHKDGATGLPRNILNRLARIVR